MDKFTLKHIRIFKAQNDGWIAISPHGIESEFTETYGAFGSKADLLEWLDDHLFEEMIPSNAESTNDQ